MLQFYNLRQIGEVALHREHTVDNNQLDSLLRKVLEYTLKVFHIVVLVVQLCSERQTASVDDARMVAVVADDIVATTHYNRQYARVNEETCRETQSLVLANIFGEFLLKLYVQVECTVKEATAGTSRTIFVKSGLGSIDDALVAGESGICI